ncbi:MAG TPA: hypothetical protein VMN35_04815 [Gaiellaceae bacterium]|nr:hypothetical protein [Gaiellaceae bacterium]
MSHGIYLSRTWTVREGSEGEFLRLWREGVDQLARQLPHATFRLWRDAHERTHFQSVGGPVASEDELDAIRGSESFHASMEAIAKVLESVEVTSYELLEEIG